jgi:hypothetical protein
MSLIKLNTNPSRRELRQFAGIWLPASMALLAWIAESKYDSPRVAIGMLCVAGVLAVLGLVWPAVARMVWIVWMMAVFPIGWIVSHLLLAAIYYLCITPIGLMLRICGVDPMHRKFDRTATTYWIPREPNTDKTSYFKQF